MSEEVAPPATEENAQSSLEENISKQVSYYFSKQNLQNDHYLVSKMNGQMYVPLEVVAGFKLLKNLTQDMDLLKKVLRESADVQLDESGSQTMIRPVIQNAQRSTIILRDIPKDVPEDEIKAIFPAPDKITVMKPDIQDTWFVSFAEEDDAKAAFDECRKRRFRDKPVKCRIKSENLLKSFLPTDGSADAPSPNVPPASVPSAGMPGAFYGGYPQFAQHMPYPYNMMGGMPGMMPGQFHGGYPGRGQPGRGHGGRGGGRGEFQNSRQQPPVPNETRPRAGSKQKGQPPKLGPNDFPPLPSSSTPESGYGDKPVTKYSKAQLIDRLKTLSQSASPLPTDLDASCSCVLQEPNKSIELLKMGDDEKDAGKSFAEATVTHKDIKPPEQTRGRGGSRKGRD